VSRCVLCADATRITSLEPTELTVNRSTTVVLVCRAETDEREASTLTVRWFTGDRLQLSRNRDPRLRVDHVRGTLRLTDAQVYDSGTYQCVASTDVDTDSAYARLTVTGAIHSTLAMLLPSRASSQIYVNYALQYVLFRNVNSPCNLSIIQYTKHQAETNLTKSIDRLS